MIVYALADLHLSRTVNKPMDCFGAKWAKHDAKIDRSLRARLQADDLLLIPGDISWAMRSAEAVEDLRFIDAWPGRKVLMRGNHDYWWGSGQKVRRLCAEHGLGSIDVLHHDALLYETNSLSLVICGTRLWLAKVEQKTANDREIYQSEIRRLERSLIAAQQFEKQAQAQGKTVKKIVMLHYPPIHPQEMRNEVTGLLEAYNCPLVLYGHLHGLGHRQIIEGYHHGIEYSCVASDYLNFEAKQILEL
ncbi:MAG: metallophosphoesterase [Eubacteriales bacterium]|nr:metallophosphoesterase [Eubacteriales bacterium]